MAVGQFKILPLLPPQVVRDTASCPSPGSSRYSVSPGPPCYGPLRQFKILHLVPLEILHHSRDSRSSSRYCIFPPPPAVRDTAFLPVPLAVRGTASVPTPPPLTASSGSSRYCNLSLPRQFEILHHSPSSSRYCIFPPPLAVRQTAFLRVPPGSSRYGLGSYPTPTPPAVRDTETRPEIKPEIRPEIKPKRNKVKHKSNQDLSQTRT